MDPGLYGVELSRGDYFNGLGLLVVPGVAALQHHLTCALDEQGLSVSELDNRRHSLSGRTEGELQNDLVFISDGLVVQLHLFDEFQHGNLGRRSLLFWSQNGRTVDAGGDQEQFCKLVLHIGGYTELLLVVLEIYSFSIVVTGEGHSV